MRPELCLAIVNTQWGPRHNKFAQTLNLEGNPIPRLYTPGELGFVFRSSLSGGEQPVRSLGLKNELGEVILNRGLLIGDPGAHALVRPYLNGQHATPRGQLVEGPFRWAHPDA